MVREIATPRLRLRGFTAGEVPYLLDKPCWGRGLAAEGARAALASTTSPLADLSVLDGSLCSSFPAGERVRVRGPAARQK
jgi:hypothetical protein